MPRLAVRSGWFAACVFLPPTARLVTALVSGSGGNVKPNNRGRNDSGAVRRRQVDVAPEKR